MAMRAAKLETTDQPTLKKAQIGRCGELLVQYRLLKHGIESASMTTDTGVDLVVYSPRSGRAKTIQVKANLKPKPAGGRGKLLLSWDVRKSSPAEMVALVDLSSERVWLLEDKEFDRFAQQHKNGNRKFYIYTDTDVRTKEGRPSMDSDFEGHLIEARIEELLGSAS
jgi:hypothetical protein